MVHLGIFGLASRAEAILALLGLAAALAVLWLLESIR
jgi:hypothetical protein